MVALALAPQTWNLTGTQDHAKNSSHGGLTPWQQCGNCFPYCLQLRLCLNKVYSEGTIGRGTVDPFVYTTFVRPGIATHKRRLQVASNEVPEDAQQRQPTAETAARSKSNRG